MKIITPIPHDVYLAISGGVDSMMMRHFLLSGRRDVKFLFMHHGTENSQVAYEFLSELIPDLIVGNLESEKRPKESDEMYWRRERYNFFDRFTDRPIITCHHLDDQVENWFMSCAKGRPKLMPYRRGNYIRPLLMCKKSGILSYAHRKGVINIIDMSNYDTSYPRNRIRHNVVPEMIKAFPGIYRTISQKIQDQL